MTVKSVTPCQAHVVSQDLGPWDPLSPAQVTHLLDGVAVPWWIAGGWAVDLHLGYPTRTHDDVDVLVLRGDLSALREHLSGWDLHAADPPGTLRPWPVGEVLPGHVSDIWCRPTPTSPWALQLVIDDVDAGGQEWIYRHDARVRRPWRSLDGPSSAPGRAVLAPEVQLLYKSVGSRPKDEADFLQLLTVLDDEQRSWLSQALRVSAGDHRWLQPLDVSEAH